MDGDVQQNVSHAGQLSSPLSHWPPRSSAPGRRSWSRRSPPRWWPSGASRSDTPPSSCPTHTHHHCRGHRTHTHTHGAATFLALQQWRPELQPRCSRKLLKSVVLMQQQLQNLYLKETMVPGYQLVGSPPMPADPVLLTPRGRRGLLGDGCSSQRRSRDPGKPSQAMKPINKPLASTTAGL